MISGLYDRPVQPLGRAQPKRDSSNFSSPSPSKRPKLASAMEATNSSHLSPPLNSNRAGLFRATKWFDETNNDASGAASYVDNDPPFYIHRQSSSDGDSVDAMPSEGSPLKRSILGQPTAPTRSLLARMESSESNSEDFRSVIDDLTIQNKKLKKKLRQYEKLHCSHLQDEKLFEVRVHGLAVHRKRELEQTLRSFASNIEDTSPDIPILKPASTKRAASASVPSTHLPSTVTAGLLSGESTAALRKPSSASTSCSKPVDSAYASMSGQTGTSQLQPQERKSSDRLTQTSQTQQNVKSFLHEIPEMLIPKQTMAMSDRSKSKIVVRRLEQIFTGRGAASRHHTQSHQQQEVSHSAARADQSRLAKLGRGRQTMQEGVREARILLDDTDIQVDTLSEANLAAQRSRQSSHDRQVHSKGTPGDREQSPDQRPTRPLDLDPHRAQVPADNIDYIKHLGLSPPTASADPGSDDGWVYLNLLMNMAQLHTLNVTPEFIRHAVADVSSKFKLSSDGTKVKWLGGSEGSRMSSDSDDYSEDGKPKSIDISSAASKCESFGNTSSKTDIRDCQEPNTALPCSSYETFTDSRTGTKRKPIFLEQVNTGHNFHYKPLFFHATPSQDSGNLDSTAGSSGSSEVMENATGMCSGINSGSHGLRETEVRLRKQNTEIGPIIFYHKARFCTDLSGDIQAAPVDESTYCRYSQDPVGCLPETLYQSSDGDEASMSSVIDFTYDNTDAGSSSFELDNFKSCISDFLSSTQSPPPVPISMEVSGLGGVEPRDNFVVDVRVRHTAQEEKPSPIASHSRTRPLHRLSRSLMGATSATQQPPHSQSSQMPVSGEIVSATKTDLKPSSLPSPSYVCLPFSSSESEEEEDEEDESATRYYKNISRSPREAVNKLNSRSAHFFVDSSSGETKESSYISTSTGNEDDDDSIDLLAHARVLDPDAVAARERDFDINAIPSGSVAATAGESSSGLIKTIPRVDSDISSMSVDRDAKSEIDDY